MISYNKTNKLLKSLSVFFTVLALYFFPLAVLHWLEMVNFFVTIFSSH